MNENLIIRRQSNDQTTSDKINSREKMIIVLLCLLMIAIAVISFAFLKTRLFNKPSDNPIIATVGKTTFLLDEFLIRYRILYARQWEMQTKAEREQLALDLIKRITTIEILLQEARKNNLLDDDELNSTIDVIIDSSLDHWKHSRLKDEYFVSEIDLQEKIKENIVAMKVKEIILFNNPVTVDNTEIDAYYQAHLEDYYVDTSMIHLKQIVFESTRTGKRVYSNLIKGKSFDEEIKKLNSSGKECPELIDLGFVQMKELDPIELQLINDAKDNEYVRYTQNNGDYIILHIVEKKSKGTIPLEKVRDEIESLLTRGKQNQIFRNWLSDKKREIPVKIYQQTILDNLQTEKVLFGLENVDEPVINT